ncbi:NAD(P)-dependent oxidoreductase [Chryseobacterium sp. EO14]|uniref:NAD-dependent epimerase/dehydratase family protein n=1 Tax=Chryseobacterium sp. EO14 TaxID=2950551 RepID=UPI00210BFACE|nr:NAD(P)-dependent oxidoreductase [Chryseobacterium sp. EO14]MCQ4142451.1 NAD(P)-dependent oxidoreductase [Chryseobacterium sp. EO14]
MNKQTSILILGASGFIGSAFLTKLKEKGYQNISVLQRKSKVFQHDDITIYNGDIRSFEWNNLQEIPDFIFHFARINSIKFRSVGRLWAALQGKKANEKLLNFFKSQTKQPKIVYMSGSLMYGNDTELVDEDHIINPISFARQYIIAEKPFIKDTFKANSSVHLVRVPWVLGEGSWFFSFYLKYIQQNKKVPIYGNGKNIMSIISLEDVTEFLTFFIEERLPLSINLTSDIFVSQRYFAEAIAQKYNMPISYIPLQNYEKAVREAFESSIYLSSKYSHLKNYIKYSNLDALLSKYLLSLEDI